MAIKNKTAQVTYAEDPQEGRHMNCMVTYKWTFLPKQQSGTKRIWLDDDADAPKLINAWNRNRSKYRYELLG